MAAQIIAFPAPACWAHPKYPPDLWHRAVEQEESPERAEAVLAAADNVLHGLGLPTRDDLPYMRQEGAPALACWKRRDGSIGRSEHRQRLDSQDRAKRARLRAEVEAQMAADPELQALLRLAREEVAALECGEDA